mmetsp:Transcript_43686/g.98735  ORF Transcript_43686/g.98735 Transcript_43686/m.98735 type:complete len:86 (+) Transcript_43686:63-320(+)
MPPAARRVLCCDLCTTCVCGCSYGGMPHLLVMWRQRGQVDVMRGKVLTHLTRTEEMMHCSFTFVPTAVAVLSCCAVLVLCFCKVL